MSDAERVAGLVQEALHHIGMGEPLPAMEAMTKALEILDRWRTCGRTQPRPEPARRRRR